MALYLVCTRYKRPESIKMSIDPPSPISLRLNVILQSSNTSLHRHPTSHLIVQALLYRYPKPMRKMRMSHFLFWPQCQSCWCTSPWIQMPSWNHVVTEQLLRSGCPLMKKTVWQLLETNVGDRWIVFPTFSMESPGNGRDFEMKIKS